MNGLRIFVRSGYRYWSCRSTVKKGDRSAEYWGWIVNKWWWWRHVQLDTWTAFNIVQASDFKAKNPFRDFYPVSGFLDLYDVVWFLHFHVLALANACNIVCKMYTSLCTVLTNWFRDLSSYRSLFCWFVLSCLVLFILSCVDHSCFKIWQHPFWTISCIYLPLSFSWSHCLFESSYIFFMLTTRCCCIKREESFLKNMLTVRMFEMC